MGGEGEPKITSKPIKIYAIDHKRKNTHLKEMTITLMMRLIFVVTPTKSYERTWQDIKKIKKKI